MHYVLLRDDDTNATTSPRVLERIYGPVLDLGVPVHLSVIPDVDTRVTLPDGSPEWYLPNVPVQGDPLRPIGTNPALTGYLRKRAYRILQHGCLHHRHEFMTKDVAQVRSRLALGRECLRDADLAADGFVAPQDRVSGVALRELAGQFPLLSTGWFERRQMRGTWWFRYAMKKARRHDHWRVGRCCLLSHPGSLLTHTIPHDRRLSTLQRSVRSRRLTVVVTHWWEYFRREQYDTSMLATLHETAGWLARARDVRVVTAAEVAAGRVPLA